MVLCIFKCLNTKEKTINRASCLIRPLILCGTVRTTSFQSFCLPAYLTIYFSHETSFKQVLFIFRSTKDLIRQYGLRLSAATFLIIDHNEASIELACQWQSCMEGEVFLDDLDCSKFS